MNKLQTLHDLYIELIGCHYRYKRFNEVKLTEFTRGGERWVAVHMNGATAINYTVVCEFEMPESEWDVEIARLRSRIYHHKNK